MAKLTFYSATEGITGSAYLIETDHATILMERKMLIGSSQSCPFDGATTKVILQVTLIHQSWFNITEA